MEEEHNLLHSIFFSTGRYPAYQLPASTIVVFILWLFIFKLYFYSLCLSGCKCNSAMSAVYGGYQRYTKLHYYYYYYYHLDKYWEIQIPIPPFDFYINCILCYFSVMMPRLAMLLLLIKPYYGLKPYYDCVAANVMIRPQTKHQKLTSLLHLYWFDRFKAWSHKPIRNITLPN